MLRGDCDLFKTTTSASATTPATPRCVRIGQMLEDDRRRMDVAARIGGEEFAVILPETDQHEAFLVAERLRMRIAEMFADEHGAPDHQLRRGHLPGARHHRRRACMLAAGDALYAAKVLGRDRSVLHSDEVAEILSAGRRRAHTRDKAQLATVLNLAEALDMRDEGTARHSQTVGRYCEMMARELGLTPDRADRVRVAGVLHDIGKIGVADSILMKPGPLTDDEYDAMKKHPEIGARILGGSGLADIRAVGPGPPRAARWPRVPHRHVGRPDPAGGHGSWPWATPTRP